MNDPLGRTLNDIIRNIKDHQQIKVNICNTAIVNTAIENMSYSDNLIKTMSQKPLSTYYNYEIFDQLSL